MHRSTCLTLIFSLITPFIAALPMSALPLAFELSQNYSLPSLVPNIFKVDRNTSNQSINKWPERLPIRFPIPNNPSSYLIIPSYVPKPLSSIDETVNALASMAHYLSLQGPDQIINSIALQVKGISWSLKNERTFDITREAALIILGAVADIEADYGVASLTNVLFQQNGIFLGSFNFSIGADKPPNIPTQEA